MDGQDSFIKICCRDIRGGIVDKNLPARTEKKKKRHRFIEQSFRLCGRRRGWDVSREQH